MVPLANLARLIVGNSEAGRVIPIRGLPSWYLVIVVAAMTCFAAIAVLATQMAKTASDQWSSSIATTVTVRADQLAGTDVARLEEIFRTSPGVQTVTRIDESAQRALLEPVVGAEFESLTLPLLYGLEFDLGSQDQVRNLQLRLEAEFPDAVLDDPAGFREPMLRTARALNRMGNILWLTVLAVLVATVALVSQAIVASNRRNIATLQLIGADDTFIVRAFVRQVTVQSAIGAVIGLVASIGVAAFAQDIARDIFPPPGLWAWFLAVLMVPLVIVVAFVATRLSAFRSLRQLG